MQGKGHCLLLLGAAVCSVSAPGAGTSYFETFGLHWKEMPFSNADIEWRQFLCISAAKFHHREPIEYFD